MNEQELEKIRTSTKWHNMVEIPWSWRVQDVREEWDGKLEELGYYDVEINFSGFSYQGDGASFIAEIDTTEWLKAHKLCNKYRALWYAHHHEGWGTMEIYRTDHHYCHENTVNIEVDDFWWYLSDNAKEQIEKVSKLVLEDARKLMREIYQQLEKEYEYLFTDEFIKAECKELALTVEDFEEKPRYHDQIGYPGI